MKASYVLTASLLLAGLGLMLVDAYTKLGRSRHKRISLILISATMFYVAMDCLWVLEYIAQDYSRGLFAVLNLLFYLAYITLPYIWFLFSHHFASSVTYSKKLKTLTAVPWLFNLGLVLLTMMGTDLLWSVGDASARYVRGPLFSLFSGLNLLYYFFPVAEIAYLFLRDKDADKQLLIRTLGFALIPALGVFVYTYFISVSTIVPFQPSCFFLGVMFAYIVLITEKYATMQKIADTDPLTGVKSKYAFICKEMETDERIAQGAVREFGVAVCDINGLKLVNDTQGHEAGDKYICQASQLIGGFFRHSPVYRIGGDEFAVFLFDQDYWDRDRIMEAFQRKAEENSGAGQITVAVGLSVFFPGDDMNVQDVFERADAQMYRRKAELNRMSGYVR